MTSKLNYPKRKIASLTTVSTTRTMASVTSISCLYSRIDVPQPSLSFASKVFEGLRVQSPNCYGAGKPNLNVEFHSRVYKSIQSRCGKATRARVTMMPIGTPRVPYRNPVDRTWQWVDVWNALYRERIIFLGQHIDEEYSNQILATMLYLDSVDDSNKLYLFMIGQEGDFTPTMAIYDTMRSLKTPVATHCLSYSYNLLSFLLAAGEKGFRSVMPLSRIVLQSPAGAARGQADDIRNETNELLRIKQYLFKELAQNTGQPVDKIHKDLSRVKRFSPQEALEYGLIDQIVRPRRIKADAPRKDSTAGLG